MTVALRVGKRPHVRWTDAEKETLRRLHASGVKFVAMRRHLPGRDVKSIGHKIAAMKLPPRNRPLADSAAEVARLHARGENDRAIGEALGLCRSRVFTIRKGVLGLPARPKRRERMSAASRKVREEGDNWAPLRIRLYEQGWPAGTTPAQADVMTVLERDGELRVRQIAERCGRTRRGVEKVVGDLRKRGDVVRARGWAWKLADRVLSARRERGRIYT